MGGKELVLNGAGIRTKVVFKVYVASLYLPAKAGDLAGVLAAKPRRVQLNLLRDLSADDLAGALADGIKETSSAEQVAAVKPQTDQLLSIMKSVGQAKDRRRRDDGLRRRRDADRLQRPAQGQRSPASRSTPR